MRQSDAWIEQVRSDYAASIKVRDDKDASTYCQAIAKYQQVAEKSVKALTAAINDLGVPVAISRSHNPGLELDALRRTPHAVLVEDIEKILTAKMHESIRELCSLAPRFPRAGDAHVRNTEYPFNPDPATLDDWTAPASVGSFTLAEAESYRRLIWVLRSRVEKFVGTTRRRRS